MNKTKNQWLKYGKKTNKLLFFYENTVYNLTYFISKHPGGKKALSNYIGKDITNILFRVFPHNKEKTLNVLKEYIVGTVKDLVQHTPIMEKCLTPKQKKKVCFFATDDQNLSDENQKVKAKHMKKSKSKSKSKSKPKSRETSNKQLPSNNQKDAITQKQNIKMKRSKDNKDNLTKSISTIKLQSSISTPKKHSDHKKRYNFQQTQEHQPILKIPILIVKNFNKF